MIICVNFLEIRWWWKYDKHINSYSLGTEKR